MNGSTDLNETHIQVMWHITKFVYKEIYSFRSFIQNHLAVYFFYQFFLLFFFAPPDIFVCCIIQFQNPSSDFH
jgi:hypothetical protein